VRKIGVVRRLEGKEALIAFKRNAACGACGGCSASSGRDIVIRASAPEGASIGDEVAIEVSSAYFFTAIIRLYFLPAAAFLAGIFSGLKIAEFSGIDAHKELFSFFTAVLFLYLSNVLTLKLGRRFISSP